MDEFIPTVWSIVVAIIIGILLAAWAESKLSGSSHHSPPEPQTIDEYVGLHYGGLTY